MFCTLSQNMLCGLKGLNAVFKGPIERFNKKALQGEAQEAVFSRLPKQVVKYINIYSYIFIKILTFHRELPLELYKHSSCKNRATVNTSTSGECAGNKNKLREKHWYTNMHTKTLTLQPTGSSHLLLELCSVSASGIHTTIISTVKLMCAAEIQAPAEVL